jgi:YfiH family protein
MMTTSKDGPGLDTLRAELLTRAGFLHGFSSRRGGASAVYGRAGELNLGLTAVDARSVVLGNRKKLLADVFGEVLPLVTVAQVHGDETLRVNRADAMDWLSDAPTAPPAKADGLVTSEPGVALGIQTADCVPVLVADRERGVVAAFHAGWRGTARRVVEQGIAKMQTEYGTRPESLVAAIGPCIGACCYTVGAEVRQQFDAAFVYSAELFVLAGHGRKNPAAGRGDVSAADQTAMQLDLKEANRRQLLAAGLEAEAVEVLPECTACDVSRFFSYRAEDGKTGRMMAVIAARSH